VDEEEEEKVRGAAFAIKTGTHHDKIGNTWRINVKNGGKK